MDESLLGAFITIFLYICNFDINAVQLHRFLI